MSGDQVRKRDAGVELARILGCMIVLGNHVYLPINGDTGRALVGTFYADGVAVFWLILGFFLFQQESFEKLIRHTFLRIFVPMFFFSLFSFYVYPYVSGEASSLLESLHQPLRHYWTAFKATIRWTPIVGHLWYLYIYILVIMAFPALQGAVQSMERSRYVRVFLLTAMMLVFMDNVYTDNDLMLFSHHTIGGMVPASMIVITGHFIYRRRDLLSRYGLLFPFIFLVMIGLRTVLYLKGYTTVICWYTFSGIVCATCIVGFSISLVDRIKSEKFKFWVRKIASHTFAVYLVHFYPISVLSHLHFQKMLERNLSSLPSFPANFIYTAVIALVVFGLSLLIAVANRAVGRVLRRFVSGLYHRRGQHG